MKDVWSSHTGDPNLGTVRPRSTVAAALKDPHSMTTADRIAYRITDALDLLAQATAWALRRVSPVTGAGVLWERTGSSFVDCWREPGAWTLRLGRLEVVADLRR